MTLIRLYKPFGVLSQFRDPHRTTLAAFVNRPGVYPAGRLDRDSEGLLLLTDDGALQARISHPRFKLRKHYWVQVEGQLGLAETARLAERVRAGVLLSDGRAHAESLRALPPPDLPPRDPPVTPHRAARSSWLEVVLTSGRNRQVRRMLAAVGLPVLRLHRARIGEIDLAGLGPGEWEEIAPPPALSAAPGARNTGGRGDSRRRRVSSRRRSSR